MDHLPNTNRAILLYNSKKDNSTEMILQNPQLSKSGKQQSKQY